MTTATGSGLLAGCRRNFGDSPRTFDRAELDGYLRAPCPGWLTDAGDEPAAEQLREHFLAWQGELCRVGRIGWGVIVQANNKLFHPGDDDLPAVFAYAVGPSMEDTPDELAQLARRMFRLKGTTQADPALQYIGDLLANEHTVNPRDRVPTVLAGGHEVYWTVGLVSRGHLPDGRLHSRPFPLLSLPARTAATMIMPSRYWADELRDRWRDDGR